MPDYKALAHLLIEPLLSSASLQMDVETTCGGRKVWLRLAFDPKDRGQRGWLGLGQQSSGIKPEQSQPYLQPKAQPPSSGGEKARCHNPKLHHRVQHRPHKKHKRNYRLSPAGM